MSQIPLFPLPLVVFPGGILPLQIFEPRYLDMVRDCLRADEGFGVVMIREGDQVVRHAEQGVPTTSHMGTVCRIFDFDQKPNGMLAITARGESRFVIRDAWEQDNRLLVGDVEFLPAEASKPLPEDHRHLADLLAQFLEHESVSGLGIEPDYDSALDVGMRLTELLPCDGEAKERLFEVRDPLARLRLLDKVINRMQGASD